MIPNSFAAALANHLWQSTVFAGLAGLLALALRRNHAGIRHWLWLAASAKFLLPFSALAAIGNRLGSLASWRGASGLGQPAVSMMFEQISQPFPQSPHAAAAAAVPSQPGLLPLILLAVWACGFLAVAFSWFKQWRRIRTAVRAASPIELEAGVPLLSSPVMLEPGVFGIFRPVLLLPQGITEHLAPDHLQAILAHELCHVRRRDNLAAALHMAVEAFFWFHPLVWWLGARLVEERERACDEEVLRLGNRPEVYAESILKTCQFYLESPLACMSGIAGSDLKKRVTRIMSHQLTNQLTAGRKLLLALAGIAAIAGPLVFGLINSPQGRAQSTPAAAPTAKFEVVSIKPNPENNGRTMIRLAPGGRFEAHNITTKFLLEEAYGVKESQLLGLPGWAGSESYDVDAKPEEPAADSKMDREQMQAQFGQMLQAMLAERFKLTLHHDTKELSVYALEVAKNGPKFHETTAPDVDPASLPDGPPKPGAVVGRGNIGMMGRGNLTVSGVAMPRFADVLSRQLGRIVVDKTGLKGDYDFTLKWTPDEGEGMFKGAGGPPKDSAPPPDASGPSIFTALQEQLGLKLESQKTPVDVLVIDHIERPSQN